MARTADPIKKVIEAAFDLAEEKGWRDVTLPDIAAKSKLSLAELRRLIRDKMQILERFQERVDAEVLAGLDPDTAGEPPRDRLFEVLMRRFEVLGPHKQALRRIHDDLKSSPAERLCLAAPALRSMEWMLAGAGIESRGLRGTAQISGLGFLYASVFQTWLEDDDAGLARTMAALDRRLRRGEALLKTAQVPIGLGQAFGQFVCNYRKARKDPGGAGDTETAPSS